MKKKATTALARTTKRTITKPERTAEIVPFERAESGAIALPDKEKFQGASQLALSKAEQKALRAPFDDDQHDVLPTGEVYVTVHYVRDRADDVLGVGQWCLVPVGGWANHGKTVTHEYYLYVRGHFVRPVIGEANHEESNNRNSWATAMEVVFSNAITRGLKFIGIAREVWDRRWNEQWLEKYAVRVWVKNPKWTSADIQWRRKDAKPLPYEKGLAQPGQLGRDDELVKPEPAKARAQASGNGELITRQQADDLIALCRKRGVTPGDIAEIVGNETGQKKIGGIKATQFGKIWTIVDKKIVASKG